METEEVVYKREEINKRGCTNGGRRGKLRVTYTNIDGLLSSVLEVRDYLKESKPDVLCIPETKLKEEINIKFTDEGYKCWRRDRKGKGGGGVIVLVHDKICVEEVQYGDDMAEIIGLTIRTSGGKKKENHSNVCAPKD